MARIDPSVADTARFGLTAVEFDVVWEALGLGPPPVVLRLASPGRTHVERRALCAASWRALRERGLAGPSGPDDGLARLLLLLGRPGRRLELRGWWGRTVRAVAADGPYAAVLAVRHADVVTVAPCDSVPSGLLGVAPRSGAGPGRCATVPTAVLAAALAAPPTELRAELRRQGCARGRGQPARPRARRRPGARAGRRRRERPGPGRAFGGWAPSSGSSTGRGGATT